MFRHFCILCATACGLWTAVIMLLVAACSGSGGGGEQEDVSIKLYFGKLQIPMFDSISVDISAADMESIHIKTTSEEDNLKIDAIPQGENRKFEVKIYADAGKLVQKGEALADIKADESIIIPITLNALAGFLKLEIPLGFTNNTGIHSGKLFLEDMEFNMKFENGKGVFSTGALPLDKKMLINIELYDSKEELLFMGKKEITLYLISQSETIQLSSVKGSAILELTINSEGPTQILAILPESAYGKRTPQKYGDLFFTEIYANPSEDDYFQYMELYNSTSDTLVLSDCKIIRIDNSSEHKIADLTIPPMSYAIIGRSKVLNKDYNCGSFTLLKSEMSLGLFCESLAVDSLTYSNKGDNKFPLEKGIAMQLPLENYENRALGSSWCPGFSPKIDAICQ